VLATGADTVFTVLSRAGGILKTGSLRSVVLTRQGKGGAVERVDIDFYASLLEGKSIDLRVREGDSIFIPAIGPVVGLAGELKRPGIYEMKGATDLRQALTLAGGALPSVRAGNVTLLRFGPSGKMLKSGDIGDAAFAGQPAGDGDFVYFGRTSDLLLGQVQVEGAVKYPGRYEVDSFRTLKSLLLKVQPLPETNLFYARLYRTDQSGRDRSFAFSPRDALGSAGDVPLVEFDRVVLYRYDDTTTDPDFDRFADTLVVTGPIKYPGFYLYKNDMMLSELLANNSLLLDANRAYAEIVRRTAVGDYEYYTFSPDSVLEGKADMALARYDTIRFVKRGEQATNHDFDKFPDAVVITGQVARPEVYALRGGMKLSWVVTKEQVLLDTNLNYGEIVRQRVDGKNEYYTFRPGEVIEGKWDIVLTGGEVIRLVGVGYNPEKPDFDRFRDAVQVTGPVQYAGLYAWREGMKLSEVVKLAKLNIAANRYYGEIVRPVGGGRNEYLTFAPREVERGEYDLELRAKDQVRVYGPLPGVSKKAGEGQGEGAPSVAPAGGGEGGGEAGQAAGAAQAGASVPAGGTVSVPVAGEGADFGNFLEVVMVQGAVRYAGPYARTPSLKLSSVITAEQILETTNLEYAELVRLRADGSEEYLTFAPKEVLEGKYDLALRAKDAIRLVAKTPFGGKLSMPDFNKFGQAVVITGQVARPEVYALRGGMKLSWVVTKEQVLLDTNLNYGEIVRQRVDGKNEYYTFRPGEVIEGKWDIVLTGGEVIRLVGVGYNPEKPDFDRFRDAVQVTGPVQYAGLYAWREGMKLSEVVKLAKLNIAANRYYGEIVRPVGGGRNEYLTFAPREVERGEYDCQLKARDRVKLYSTAMAKVVPTAQGTAEVQNLQSSETASTVSNGGIVVAPQPATTPVGVQTDLGLYLEVVYTLGTIRYAGPYARTPSLKLSSVVTKDQILQDTNLDYAELTRRKADGSWEYLTFSPREVLEQTYDIPLRAMDSIRFVPVKYLPEKVDFDKFSNAIAIQGEANFPGLYSFSAPKMLSEILTPEQLLSTTDIHYAEIERRQKSGRVDYLTFSPMAVLKGYQDIRIYPRDIIRFVAAGDTGQNHDFSKYADTVLLTGVIRYPGRYAWYRGMKLSDIVQESDLLIDTETTYAEVRRSSVAGDSLVQFSPSKVVFAQADVELQSRDTVVFYPKYAQKPISVAGEMLDPKVIPYYEQIELSSVFRSVTLSQDPMNLKAEIKKTSGETTVVYLEDYLKRQPTAKILLSPGDAITVKALLPDEHLPSIVVRGEVENPQTLPFTEGMRLSHALAAVGCYTLTAYPKGLVLIRKSVATAQQVQVDRLIAQYEAATAAGAALPTVSSSSSTSLSAFAVIANMHVDLAVQKTKLGTLKQMYKEGFGRVALEIPNSLEALKGTSSDIKLERDDLIYVPKMPTYVLVSGEVSSQNVVLYKEGLTVRQALTESGWVLSEADLAHAYIIRASGKLDSTEGKGFLFFRPNILNYRLEPGDTVYVPTKSSKLSMTWAYLSDAFGIVGSILTTALTAKTLLGL
jgi:protein involved in polysaccharide export with SLBB domain